MSNIYCWSRYAWSSYVKAFKLSNKFQISVKTWVPEFHEEIQLVSMAILQPKFRDMKFHWQQSNQNF